MPRPKPVSKSTAPHAEYPTVSARWLLSAAAISLAAAAACGWLTLCLLFWQGSWQLLYHPISPLTRTPASVGIAFEPIAFAATEAGEARLKGWWIPAATDARSRRFTVLYLHGQKGNLANTIDALAALHRLGLNVLAFDYRGYGQSQFAHPSEARWREDAEWALTYLTATRHVAADSIVVEGRELGANLALEVGAGHPELGGVVLESPMRSPVEAIFGDPRARLVPAHLLVHDRFDAQQAAALLRVSSLWFVEPLARGKAQNDPPAGYGQVRAQKTLVWLATSVNDSPDRAQAYTRWLDDLPAIEATH